MNKKWFVFCLFIVLGLSSLHVQLVFTLNNTSTRSLNVLSQQQVSTNEKLELFSNTTYIKQGDTINITFSVYYNNYTLVPNVLITFTFDSTTFYKYSSSQLTTFTILVNQTYSQVTLQGKITSDLEELTFYDSSQQPNCLSGCLSVNMAITQLQVFNNFQASFSITFTSNEQFFDLTDILEVNLQPYNTLIYFNQTGISNYGNIYGLKLNKTITVIVPIIHPGNYSVVFSFYSSYYFPLQVNKQVSIVSSAIGVSLANNSIDRLNIGESANDYITYSFNFDTTNMQYSYYIANNQSIVYTSSGSVINSLLKLPISVAYYYPVGQYFLNLELVKNNNVLYSKMVPVTIYDNIITNLVYNNELISGQLSIPFTLTTYIEDTLINYPSTVNIYNNDSKQLLISFTLSVTKDFTLNFPNKTSIPSELYVVTTTNNTLYHGSSKYYPIYSKEQTVITTNYNNSIQVERLQRINVHVMVNETHTNQTVTQGLVDLTIDGINQSELDLQITNTFNYVVPADFPVGKHLLVIQYLGNNTFSSASVNYDYYVYSNVHFADVIVNNTFTNPTTPILIQGKILDENDTGVVTKVSLLDSNNTIIDQTVSNSDGNFSFIILNTNALGYYNYILRAETVNYYKSAEYNFNLLQNNKFTVNIVANETMSMGSISIKGDIYGEYMLNYYTDPSNNINIRTLNLNSNGELVTNFLTPNVIGPVFFNVTNVNNPSQTWVNEFILYKTPNATIQQLTDAIVGKNVNISITSDVAYNLFFNDKMITDQYYYINKTVISLPVDTKGINTLQLSFTEQYLTKNQVTKEILVYENIHLLQNLPQKVNENTNVTVYIQAVNNKDVPVGMLELQFMYLDKVLESQQLDNQGRASMYITLNDQLNKYYFRIVGNKDLYIKEEDFPVNTTLIRTLTVTSDISAKHFMDLTSTTVNFIVLFKNTGRPAQLVNMTVEITDPQGQKDINYYTTNNQGSILVTIAKPAGTYILSIFVNNPDYSMAKSIYTIQVTSFNVANNPYILPTILVSLTGILVIIRKKGIK